MGVCWAVERISGVVLVAWVSWDRSGGCEVEAGVEGWWVCEVGGESVAR